MITVIHRIICRSLRVFTNVDVDKIPITTFSDLNIAQMNSLLLSTKQHPCKPSVPAGKFRLTNSSDFSVFSVVNNCENSKFVFHVLISFRINSLNLTELLLSCYVLQSLWNCKYGFLYHTLFPRGYIYLE